jgi:hypothetical protein
MEVIIMKRMLKTKPEFEPIFSMARIGDNDIKGTFCVYVNPTEGGSQRYIKVYNHKSHSQAENLIRLSFDRPVYYDHKSQRDPKPLWLPRRVPFKTLHNWLDKPSQTYKGLSNWQLAIHSWNNELGMGMSFDEFLNFNELGEWFPIDDKLAKCLKNKQFVKPCSVKPDWHKNMSEG